MSETHTIIVATALIVLSTAACSDRSKGFPRATVITPTATYPNVQVGRVAPPYTNEVCTIYTDDGKIITVSGTATIIWNSEGERKTSHNQW